MMTSLNNFLNDTSKLALPNQNVNTGSSPIFNRPTMETPVLGDRWEDVNVAPFSTSLGPNVRPPDITKYRDNGLGSTGTYVYTFDDAREPEVFFTCQLPHSYKQGSDIKAHCHFSTPTQTATTITWGLEYTWVSIGAVAAPSVIISNATPCPPAYQHTIGSIGTISGAGKGISSILVCRLFRTPGGYAGSAALLSVDFHIQLDSIGSTTDISK